MKKIIPLLAATLCAFSCIKEQTDNCPGYTAISHHYTLNSSGTNKIDEEIDSLKILVFNPQGIFSYYSEEKNPSPLSYTTFRLLPSVYTVLTIGGDHSSYTIMDTLLNQTPKIGVTLIQNIEFGLPLLFDQTPSIEPSELFISEITPFTSQPLTYNNCDVGLIKMVKKLTLKVIGAPTHTAYISIPHSTISYDGYPSQSAKNVIYQEEGISKGDTIEYAYNTLRLYQNDTTAFINLDFSQQAISDKMRLTDGDNTTIALMDAIQQNPDYDSQEALDKEENFNVEINYNGALGIEVSINGWVIQDIQPY